MAALATAGATDVSNLGSKALGIIYSGPKLILFKLYAALTTSGTGFLAKSAIAYTAANFISSLIQVALTSKAPRNM